MSSAEKITLRQYLITQLLMNVADVDYPTASEAIATLAALDDPEWDLDQQRTWDEWEATRMQGEKRVSWR